MTKPKSTEEIVNPNPEGLEKAQKIVKDLYNHEVSEEFLRQMEECLIEDRYFLADSEKKGD
jgi:hypothetical protein